MSENSIPLQLVQLAHHTQDSLFLSHTHDKRCTAEKKTTHSHRAGMGYKPSTICRMLWEGGVKANRMRIHKQEYMKTRSVRNRPGSGQLTKTTTAVSLSSWWGMRRSNSNGGTAAALWPAQTSSILVSPLFLYLFEYPNDAQLSVMLYSPLNCPGLLDHLFNAESFLIILFSNESFWGHFIQWWIF